uniref:Uncharacterized protein n=1 Tax=Timema shepardi TaxID=629360 RepID=A0A7R9ATD5_TIMSH|nr:unnamed protein product [Timema shepardi]
MEHMVRIPCSSSLTSVTPFSITDILMTRGKESLHTAHALGQEEALDMTRKSSIKINGLKIDEVNPHLRGGRVENNLGKPPPVHPSEIRTLISPSSAVQLNTKLAH